MRKWICPALIAALAVLLAGGGASAKNIFIDPAAGIDGPPNTGRSLTDPFATISFALSGASPTPIYSGDVIICMPGVYDTAAPSAEVFPIFLPTGVSLVGPGGAAVTFIVPPAGFGGTSVIVAGPNGIDTVVSGFSMGGPPAGLPPTGFNGVYVSGGVPTPWPTSPAPPIAAGPGVASPTIEDNVMAGFGNCGVSTSGLYGSVTAKVRGNVAYGNGVGVCNFGLGFLGPYYGNANIYNNLSVGNYYGFLNLGIYYFAFPLFRSNVSYANAVAGHFAYSFPPFAFTYANRVNETTFGQLYGLYTIAGYGPILPEPFVNNIAYYNGADLSPVPTFGYQFLACSDVGVPPGPAFGPSNLAIPPGPFVGPAGQLPAGPIPPPSPVIDQGCMGLGIMPTPFPWTHPPTGKDLISSLDYVGRDNRVDDFPGLIHLYYGGPGPYPDMGADEVDPVPCMTGTVNTGTGAPCVGDGTGRADVLYVNGSSGGVARTVQVDGSVSVAVSLGLPPLGSTNPNKYYVQGCSGTPTPATQTVWPKSVGTGCFPLCGGGCPIIANTAKPGFCPPTPEATGCTPQPCTILDIPPGVLGVGTTWTFQGVTLDNGGPGSAAGGAICASVTNGVIVAVN